MTANLKTPPHSIEAEQSVLGGLMLDNNAWDHIADRINEEDFYRRDHRLIFRAVGELSKHKSPFDAVTLSEWLDRNQQLEDVGGLAYLGTLVKDTPSSANIVAYAKIVRDYSVLRNLRQAGRQILEMANTPRTGGLQETLSEAERLIYDVAMRGHGLNDTTVSASSIVPSTLNRIDELSCLQGNITGIPSEFIDLDEMTAGFQNSDFIVIAGRPSMGKTSFAMNLAENAALTHELSTLVFSLEMPSEQLIMRMLASIGRVELQRIRTGQLDEKGDWKRVIAAANKISAAPIFLNDTPALTPTKLLSMARRAKREHDIGMLVIDYLQLMHVSEIKNNRQQEISEISRALKAMAKELNIPVIALSQLNRSLEQRPNKRPVMSDLRDSGAIEQDADMIAFVYRDEVYNEDSPDAGTAEIIIGKQRNGPIGSVRLSFQREYCRFENHSSYLPPELGGRSSPALQGPRESTDEPPIPALPPMSAYDDINTLP